MECPKSQWFSVPYSVNHPYPLILSLSKDQLLVKVENGWCDKLTVKNAKIPEPKAKAGMNWIADFNSMMIANIYYQA